jgi:hypothetical protein
MVAHEKVKMERVISATSVAHIGHVAPESSRCVNESVPAGCVLSTWGRGGRADTDFWTSDVLPDLLAANVELLAGEATD